MSDITYYLFSSILKVVQNVIVVHCRVGGQENYFHCLKCDLCLQLSLKDSHKVSVGHMCVYRRCYFVGCSAITYCTQLLSGFQPVENNLIETSCHKQTCLRAGCRNARLTARLANRELTVTARLTCGRVARSKVS